jgi:hypothetical protein
MKLKSLLAAGKSFNAIRESRSPFEMRHDGLLPTFENQPRFREVAPVVESGAIGDHEELWKRAEEPKSYRGNDIIEAPPKELERPIFSPRTDLPKSAPASARGTQRAAVTPRCTPTPKREGSWFSLLWERIFPRRRKKGRSFVQGELGLANVKVVRNDLSDSDLELVMVGQPQRSTSPRLITKPVEFFRVLQRQS